LLDTTFKRQRFPTITPVTPVNLTWMRLVLT
jgi:hypothetical protein